MKYNLLFIYTDEQRRDTLGAYGNTLIQTPNLDSLASRSFVFDKTYVTQPVCTPSRSSLLTGLYPHTSGCIENNIPLADDTLCLPEMLSDKDIVTGHHGKWHLGDELFPQHGFQDWVSIEDIYWKYFQTGRDRSARSSYHQFLLSRGYKPKDGDCFGRAEAARLPEEVSKPAFLAQEASRFLRDNRSRPFVLHVNFFEPHMPFFGPRDDQYNPESISLPLNYSDFPSEDQPLKTRFFKEAYYRTGSNGLRLQTESDWRRITANYWGLCSLVDTHVGMILETLEECGLSDRTIVVYTSDHGDMMGSHRLLAKCVMFEEALRVPFILHLPGQREDVRVSRPVSQIDIVPTLLDLLGETVPDHLQGVSWKAYLEAEGQPAGGDPSGGGQSGGTPPDGDVMIEWNGSNNGIGGDMIGDTNIPEDLRDLGTVEQLEKSITDPVRAIIGDDGWKFNLSTVGEDELYDLNEDPGERNNLAGDPRFKPLIEERTRRIREWQDRTGDTAVS